MEGRRSPEDQEGGLPKRVPGKRNSVIMPVPWRRSSQAGFPSSPGDSALQMGMSTGFPAGILQGSGGASHKEGRRSSHILHPVTKGDGGGMHAIPPLMGMGNTDVSYFTAP
jgi:hypothetical protein